MATQADQLAEIASKLRKLNCICENTAGVLNLVVRDYQKLDCNGDPVGSPIDVLPVLNMAKQDVAICNTSSVALAINGAYNINDHSLIPISTTTTLSALFGVAIGTIHRLHFTVLTTAVTVTMNAHAVVYPVGNYTIFEASQGLTNDVTFATSGSGTVIVSIMRSA